MSHVTGMLIPSQPSALAVILLTIFPSTKSRVSADQVLIVGLNRTVGQAGYEMDVDGVV